MGTELKVVAIVQARLGSTRLPSKVLKKVCGRPLIELLLARLAKSKRIDKIVVATTSNPRDLILGEVVNQLGYDCEYGSEQNVLDRFLRAAERHEADIIVRITGDCPLIDPELVDQAIEMFLMHKVDFLSNGGPRPTFPDGLDVEVFSWNAFKRSAKMVESPYDEEHVTPRLYAGAFLTSYLSHEEDLSSYRWTVDEQADLDVIKNVCEHFNPNIYFGWKEVVALQKKCPDLFKSNSEIVRNQGAVIGTGQKLWKRAKSIIPGGNMLLSKRPEMFLPDQWPAYFSRAKGCKVWDLDGREYIDMAIMGIGTNILGYGNEEVDDAVKSTVNNGNMSSLNCPEEVYLAERLIDIHPWADMVRFARSGGEANAIAIRIARAASGKDKVAVCGYHGWHDWYLSANLTSNESLAGHILPGLSPVGVPGNLKDTVFTFNYNDFEGLEALVNQEDIGIIKMEVVRNKGPENDFLQKVRNLATQKGIVLIFDECTSGFRQSFGGMHKIYGVEPDMAMFGKALGNGYAITAVIGRREIMDAAQSTFISSTFWTERIGPSAALKTLEVMERCRSWEVVTQMGLHIRSQWQILAEKYDLNISIWGFPAISGFTFDGSKALEYKTLITQEMLKKGYLVGNSVYVSIAHTPEIVQGYFDALEPIFEKVQQCEQGLNILELLEGPTCHEGFKRLN
jgi:glutamate-1-semialdehyde 2,1-aminomutase